MESRETIDINLQNLWLSIKRRWLPAVGVFGCVLGLSVGAASLQKPVYRAEGKLLLKKLNQNSSITELSQNYNEQLKPLTQEGNPLNTQIEIISSVPLAKKTISALKLKDEQGTLLHQMWCKLPMKAKTHRKQRQ